MTRSLTKLRLATLDFSKTREVHVHFVLSKRAEQERTKSSILTKKNRFMNFNSIPVNLSCKLFDILIRPILTYNSEIWLFIGSVCNLQKYSIAWVLIYSVIGNLPSSDLAEILHAIFFKPKIYLQNLLCSPNFYYKNVLLTETKEYNFLGNVIDFKDSFKKATQELSKKGLKVLFSLNRVGLRLSPCLTPLSKLKKDEILF
jgi:hypothetical protein